MDDYFIRWMCSYCNNIHTRRIEPSRLRDKPEVVHMETFDSPWPNMGDEYQDLVLRKDGNSVLITLVSPINLTCVLNEATVPYERRTVKRTDV
jgi:hypothetical protein